MQQIKTTMKAASSSSSSSSSCYGLRKARLSPYLFTSLTFIVFIAILFGKYFSFMSGQINANPTQPIWSINKNRETLPFAVGKTPEGCDLFSGRWVWGDSNRPLYEESECPYIPSEMTCQEHGRPDKDYLYWRWQPHGCDLPGFNATLMLEKLRRKRMLFVGDSLNRGQFISMLCLRYSLIPENAKSLEYFDSLTVVTGKGYNATVEFYWAPFLLESNSDDSTFHRIPDRIVRKGSINKHGQHWKGVDILVFNTYQWWITSGSTIKIQEGSFDDKNKKIVHMPIEDAYRMVIKSMLRWMKLNADPKKTRVFFASMSPLHARRINWGGEPGINCYNKTILIEDPTYWGSHCSKDIMQPTGEEFSNSKFPITFLNITQLSLYQIDAHTSIYKKFWRTLTPEELADPNKYADCTHWCLPGVQDTWNELLFAKLFYP